MKFGEQAMLYIWRPHKREVKALTNKQKLKVFQRKESTLEVII